MRIVLIVHVPFHYTFPGRARFVRRCPMAILLRGVNFLMVGGAGVLFVGVADAASYTV